MAKLSDKSLLQKLQEVMKPYRRPICAGTTLTPIRGFHGMIYASKI